MKRVQSFWRDLENYTWKIIGRVSPALPWLGIALVLLTVIVSIRTSRTSLVGIRGLREAALHAARAGDYELAQHLWENRSLGENDRLVLGVESELEDLVYPERVVEREITRYETLLLKYPGHRDIYLWLAELNTQVGRIEKAQEFFDLAKELDPNNPVLAE